MHAEQFQELYKLLRGSRSALAVLDASTLFGEKRMQESYAKLLEAREAFIEGRSRVLRQAPERHIDPKMRDAEQQLKKLKRKQGKTLEAIDVFDDLLPQLEKFADRERRRQELADLSEPSASRMEPSASRMEPSASPARPEQPTDQIDGDADDRSPHASTERIARREDLDETLLAALASAALDQRLDLINEQFSFREVQSDVDLHADSLYYVQMKNEGMLVCTPGEKEMASAIELISLLDDRTIKPVSRSAFLKLGIDRKMVLLTCPEQREPGEVVTGDADGSELAVGVASSVLDLGAFSQLLTSAQRCGLIPDADQIAFVRDREFRMGNYDLAFQAIDTMFARFLSSAGQRMQQLTREDAEIASGRLQISPKDLLAKRSRDRAQTQEVERAKRRFQVVLEGLRVLMSAT